MPSPTEREFSHLASFSLDMGRSGQLFFLSFSILFLSCLGRLLATAFGPQHFMSWTIHPTSTEQHYSNRAVPTTQPTPPTSPTPFLLRLSGSLEDYVGAERWKYTAIVSAGTLRIERGGSAIKRMCLSVSMARNKFRELLIAFSGVLHESEDEA